MSKDAIMDDSACDELEPSYFAVIPYPVLAADDISDGAKLLYGRITALTSCRGYCYATNSYLAKSIGKQEDTVTRLVSSLRKSGFVDVEIVRDPETSKITERRIYPLVDTAHPSRKNFREGIGKKSDTPPGKKSEESIRDKSKEIEIPPKAPQGADRSRREPKKAPDHKPERFARFWEFYPRGENKQGAIRAWDRLSPTDDLIDRMAKALVKQMESENWKNGIGIPYASTWLNQRRWEDELDKPACHVQNQPAVDILGGLQQW